MKSELQTLRLFSPLFPHIYRKNEWGDLDDYQEDLSAGEVLEYEDKILALIQKEKLPSEGERGLAVYLDDDLSRKVYSINPTVEEWNGELWGVTELQTHDTLSPFELAELTEWISGQFSDGWGEGLEQIIGRMTANGSMRAGGSLTLTGIRPVFRQVWQSSRMTKVPPPAAKP